MKSKNPGANMQVPDSAANKRDGNSKAPGGHDKPELATNATLSEGDLKLEASNTVNVVEGDVKLEASDTSNVVEDQSNTSDANNTQEGDSKAPDHVKTLEEKH